MGNLNNGSQSKVYIDGVFDLLHYGHANILKKAKMCGAHLMVGVLSDETVASYKRKPIMNMDERAQIISQLSVVDSVLTNAPLAITRDFINEHSIDVVVHGNDAQGSTLNEWFRDPIEMGIYVSVPYTDGISTTEIINRIGKHFGHER